MSFLLCQMSPNFILSSVRPFKLHLRNGWFILDSRCEPAAFNKGLVSLHSLWIRLLVGESAGAKPIGLPIILIVVSPPGIIPLRPPAIPFPAPGPFSLVAVVLTAASTLPVSPLG